MKWRIILILFLTSSCNNNFLKQSSNTISSKENCSDVEKYIKNNWKKNKVKEYFYCTDEALIVIQRDYRKCLLNLNRDEIIKLFGSPVIQEEKEMVYYYLNEGCLHTLLNNCNTLIFYFNKTGNLLDYRIMPFVSHD